jgi:hypothetical protein
MNQDEPPTRRESGQLAVFEQTVRDALTKLSGFDLPTDDQLEELEAEGRSLLTTFVNWKTDPPIGADRTRVIERVMDFHRNVENFAASRRSP